MTGAQRGKKKIFVENKSITVTIDLAELKLVQGQGILFIAAPGEGSTLLFTHTVTHQHSIQSMLKLAHA